MFRLTTNVARMNTPQQVGAALAEVVRAAIKDAGLSQRGVAAAAGMPLVTLNRRLTGHSAFTVVEVAAIAAVVGIGVTELFVRAEDSSLADAG